MIFITIRSVLFNIMLYFSMAIACLVFLPAVIFPKRFLLLLTKYYFVFLKYLEKYVAGITYSVEGQEHIPDNGSYIVGMKHFSTYETLKLFLLFDHPAVILKQELMKIPLWGWYACKLDSIPINRTNRESAFKSIIQGAKRVLSQNRAIIIFPQGTRVRITDTPKNKPYKQGIAAMAQETGMPIVPLAHNSAQVWPRKSFLKYPGHVVFRFLEPIHIDHSMSKQDILKILQERTEHATAQIMDTHKHSYIRKAAT